MVVWLEGVDVSFVVVGGGVEAAVVAQSNLLEDRKFSGRRQKESRFDFESEEVGMAGTGTVLAIRSVSLRQRLLLGSVTGAVAGSFQKSASVVVSIPVIAVPNSESSQYIFRS